MANTGKLEQGVGIFLTPDALHLVGQKGGKVRVSNKELPRVAIVVGEGKIWAGKFPSVLGMRRAAVERTHSLENVRDVQRLLRERDVELLHG